WISDGIEMRDAAQKAKADSEAQGVVSDVDESNRDSGTKPGGATGNE
ncbi:MAG: hypothetical protein GX610_02000, partial [Rhodococcus sp.]|nr:hypothetical protein [Rhodococcus sp. (in: high G+C Gram-positive bacteria)]